MKFYAAPEDEARAIYRSAARVGCKVRSMTIADTAHGPRAIGAVECPDGWFAAKMLLALAIEDSQTPGARDVALMIRQQAASDPDFAMAVQRYVKDNVAFVREAGEVFQGGAYTLASRAGDCDDHFRLVYALAAAGGIPAALGTLHKGKGPTHAAAVLCPEGHCAWAETTVDAGYGEAPLDAARRLGLVPQRGDLADQVIVMTEKNLAPIPDGFVQHQPPGQVARDMQALEMLGYLGAPADPNDPTDMRFRHAVLALQTALGITADGLVGPQTRHAIASQLPPDEFGTMYSASIEGIGAAAPAPVTAATSDLTSGFFRQVWQTWQAFKARGATMPPEAILNVLMNESGIKARSHLPENHPAFKYGYSGLNGMGNAERKAVGAPFDVGPVLPDSEGYLRWIGMTEEEQFPFVAKFIESNVRSFGGGDFSKLTNAGALYLLNFLPAYFNHADDPSFVLADRDRDTHGWYKNNTGLDVGKKGYIEVADMDRVMAQVRGIARFKEAKARLYAEGPTTPETPAGSSGPLIAGALGLVVAIGAGLAAWHHFRS